MSKRIIVESHKVKRMAPVGITRVYIPSVMPGGYPIEVFIDDLKRSSILYPPGNVDWNDVVSSLIHGNFVTLDNKVVSVTREFSARIVTNVLQEVEEDVPVTRDIPTMVGILRWAAEKKGGTYLRVKELLVYWTPDSAKIADSDALKIDFFRQLLECTPIMKHWGFGLDTIMAPGYGWGYPYSADEFGGRASREHARKAVFEISETTSEYEGFWEYSDYDMEEFLDALEAIEAEQITFDDLKLMARGGKSMASGIMDVDECLKELRATSDTPAMPVIKVNLSK